MCMRTGNCGFSGENCTLIETTLENPTTPGTGSVTDINLLPTTSNPHRHLSLTSQMRLTLGVIIRLVSPN